MSEWITSLLVVSSEVGFFLLLIVGGIIFWLIKRGRDNKVLAKTLVETLKENEPGRRSRLKEVLMKVQHLDEKTAARSAEKLLQCEKALYAQVIKIFLGSDRNAIVKLNKNVERLAESYQKLSQAQAVDNSKYHSDDNPLKQAQLRKEVKKISQERDKLKQDLDEAMDSMDSMLQEYTQMYAGGTKREGVKHLENELLQLRQKILEGMVEEHEEEEGGAQAADPETDLDVDEVVPPDSKGDGQPS